MNRRTFTQASAAAAAAAASSQGAPPRPAFLELRYYRMRNTPDNQLQRTGDFLQNIHAPAVERAGARPAGFFASTIAPDSPFILSLTSYPSLGAMETALEKLAADREYQKGLEAAYAKGLLYSRTDSSLCRAFDSIPQVEIPSTGGGRPPRIFELRTYESNDQSTLKRKVAMFNQGEIAIFRKLNMTPVFFGEAIVGRNLPQLTYMLAFDDFASRDSAWRAFGADPDWKKMRATPGWADAEIVSNISNAILRPLTFSAIR